MNCGQESSIRINIYALIFVILYGINTALKPCIGSKEFAGC